jgi:hypothetical protein
MSISIPELKVIWVVGALERLATLGFLQETPHKLSVDTIDLYLQVDESRNILFTNDEEMKEIMYALIEQLDESQAPSKDTVNGIYNLLKQFKYERDDLVKYSLSRSF